MSADVTREQLGFTVLDAAGGLLGRLDTLYADADSGRVLFGGVTMIRRGRRRTVFVPLDHVSVAERTIRVRCGNQLVRRAPGSAQPGRGLPAEDEPALFVHYEMDWTPPTTSSRRLLPVAG